MEINLKKLGQQAIETTTDSKKMRLSEDASSMVFQLFTKNVYSNPIGTVVREITSNCFDSHTEAGINAPVLIKKHQDKESNTHYISFIDYGVGMSPDRIENVYGVYFESTKRADNTQIGGFGIGGKTPLAYKRSTGQGEGEYDNSFYIITVFDKVKYFYCIYEGTECPIISKLHEEPTTERNGTEIQIPVLEKDMSAFSKEMVRQLYYFENIIFEGFEDDDYRSETLTNDYQIIRGKSFLFRGDDYGSYIHVCLGRVTYPIDYNILGLSSSDYSLPIALKLEVGDIGVTVSRESLDYSEATIKMLKKKLETAKQEIATLIGKQYKKIQTLEQYFQVKHDFGKLEFPNDITLYVGDLIKQNDVDFSNFKYQFMKMPNDKQLFKFFFDAHTYGKKERNRWGSNINEFEGGYETLKNKSNLLYVEDEFKRKVVKQAYLKDQYTTYYIIKKRVINNWMRKDIADTFNVHIDSVTDDKGKTISFVQELMEMQEEYFEIVRKHADDYDQLEVPADFIVSRKRGSGITPELRKITIPVKFVSGYSRDRIKLSTLFDYDMPIFYGTTEDEYTLKSAVDFYHLLFNYNGVVNQCDYQHNLQTSAQYHTNANKKSSIMFIQLAVNNIKYMKYCKNARHIKDFFTYMLPRKESMVRQYFQTYQLIEKYDELSKFYKNGFIHKISADWGKKVDVVDALIDAIPEKSKNSSIQQHKHSLNSHFKLNDIVLTKEQKEVVSMIDEIIELQKNNEKTLTYFNIPWEVKHLEEEQILLMQLAMNLS